MEVGTGGRRAEVGEVVVVVEEEEEEEVEGEGDSAGEGLEINGEVTVERGHTMSLIIGMIKAREKTHRLAGCCTT